MTAISIRPLVELDDLRAALRLQQTVWGFSDEELVPLRMFVVAIKVGGQVFGAFDGPRMVGFCISYPGIHQGGGCYLHSHMLGVEKEYRDRHVGRALKLAQRDDALARGIDLIEWTFDPFELKNAYFNIERLGAIVRRYVANQYGITASPLHGGLPTDRCVAEWWLASARVKAIVGGCDPERGALQARVELPEDIGDIRRERPDEALRIQTGIRGQFQDYFARGLAVVGFERPGSYLFGRWR